KSRGRQAPQKQVKKSKSKNPAKAAREQAEAAKKAAAGSGTGGSAFGGGAKQAGQPDLSDFDPSQLPPEMQKLLGGKCAAAGGGAPAAPADACHGTAAAPGHADRHPVLLGPGWATSHTLPGQVGRRPVPPFWYVSSINPVVARFRGPRSLLGQVGRRPVPLSWYVSSINPAVARFGGPEPCRGRRGEGPVPPPRTCRRSTLGWAALGVGGPGPG